MTNHAEHYTEQIEGRHYTGPWLVDPELDDWVPVANMEGTLSGLNGSLECNPKRGLLRDISTKIIIPINTTQKYPRFSKVVDGVHYTNIAVYLVVCSTVYGYHPDGLDEINHKDFNKHNSSAANLEWCNRIYNIWYNRKKPRVYYVYTADSFEKIKEFPNKLSVLEYYNIKEFLVKCLGSMVTDGKCHTSIYGCFITSHNYGDVIKLQCPKSKKSLNSPIALYNKITKKTLVFKSISACERYLGVSTDRISRYLRNHKKEIPFLPQYILYRITYKEYHAFYDQQFKDATVELVDMSFTNKQRRSTVNKIERNFVCSKIKGIKHNIHSIEKYALSEEDYKELLILRDKLGNLISNHEQYTMETPQCPTTQTHLSLCA